MKPTCTCHDDHNFIEQSRREVMKQDHAGYRWWALELRCSRCGYEMTDYICRKLEAHELTIKSRKSRLSTERQRFRDWLTQRNNQEAG